MKIVVTTFIAALLFSSCAYTQSNSFKIFPAISAKPVAGEMVATFSEGCFWHAEIVFQSLAGVRDAVYFHLYIFTRLKITTRNIFYTTRIIAMYKMFLYLITPVSEIFLKELLKINSRSVFVAVGVACPAYWPGTIN